MANSWPKEIRIWFRRHPGFLMVLPAFLVMLSMAIFPLFYSLGVSFLRWEPKLPGRPFIGFNNYKDLLTNLEFWSSLKVSAILVVCSVTLELFIGLGLALLMIGPLRAKRIFMPILMRCSLGISAVRGIQGTISTGTSPRAS